jgi:DNA helicase-2/ATP-dependent DNA helicase PcrA
LVDEYQDTNVAQDLWLRLLAQAHKNICCVGDDDQCLAAGARITMADGGLKPIEHVKAGDKVLSAFGSGDFRPAEVTRVFKRARRGEMIALTTECGRRLVSTPEHIHFADYRAQGLSDLYFVYLMYKEGVGYRLGVSSSYVSGRPRALPGYKTRSVQEHADAVWVVSTHLSENEARAEEYILSLKYGLPTLPFTPRKGRKNAKGAGGLVHDAHYIARVFAAFDTQRAARDVMADFGLSPSFPHHRPQSRDSNRHTVRITLCGDRRGAMPMHRISIAGNDPAVATVLRGLGLSVRAARKDDSLSWRMETANKDWGVVAEIAKRIAAAVPSLLVRAARLGPGSPAREGNSLLFMPASSVRPGMSLFTGDGTYARILKVEQVSAETHVHDLDVHPTHNFVAEGVVTHNSIYSWRGAEVGNILRFEQDFPGARVVRLERNYRSTPHILGAASGLIAKNEGRLGKTLWTDLGDGEKVRVHGVWDSIEEARWVGEEIEARQTRNERLSSMAILVRTSAQTREFEERLITLGIPYQVIGGLRFYERREIRDAVAYLRIIAQPDDDLAFQRIVNFPKRGLGDKTLQTIHLHARARGISLTTAVAELTVTDELGAKARKTLADLMVDFSRWRGDAGRLPPSQLMDQVLTEAGIIEYWKLDKSIEAPGRVDNLKELVVGLSEFDTLTSFLEHVSLVMDNEDLATTDKVTVMTLHGAKGLEFDTVFLPGWEEGLFPHQRALDETGVQGLEEERRLAYVGLTRAKRMALISFAANRRIFGQWQSSLPSRFVEELPHDHIERAGDVGVSSGGGVSFDDGPSDAFKRKTNAGYGNGWKRAAQRRPADEIVYAPARVSSGGLSVGQRVFHQKFGYGVIKALDGDKLDIQFEKAGYKKVMASFVEPA